MCLVAVGIANKGCSGLSYVVEYANEQKKFEEVVESHGVKIFIDPAAIMFLIGAEMGYFETKLESGFTFKAQVKLRAVAVVKALVLPKGVSTLIAFGIV